MGMCLIQILHRTAFPQRSVQNSTRFSVAGRQQVYRPAQNSRLENCAKLQGFEFPDVQFCTVLCSRVLHKSVNLPVASNEKFG